MEPTTSTTAREDLAKTATNAFYVGGTNLNLMTAVLRLAWFRVADAIIAAGYRKPRVLGYVVVGRDGRMHRTQYATRDTAQEVADEWGSDAREAGIDWDYRVVEIVESAQ